MAYLNERNDLMKLTVQSTVNVIYVYHMFVWLNIYVRRTGQIFIAAARVQSKNRHT